MRVITWWALLALVTTMLATIVQATLVVPPVQSLRPVVDTFPLAVASASLPYVPLPSGRRLLLNTRTRLAAYHEHHRGRPGSMFRRLAAARLLYRIWGERSLKDYAVFPIEVCPYDSHTCSAKEFARRFKDREAFWINTLKTLEERGFNVRNEKPVKRRINFFRHQQQLAQRRANAAQLAGGPMAGPPISTTFEETHGSNAMPGRFFS